MSDSRQSLEQEFAKRDEEFQRRIVGLPPATVEYLAAMEQAERRQLIALQEAMDAHLPLGPAFKESEDRRREEANAAFQAWRNAGYGRSEK